MQFPEHFLTVAASVEPGREAEFNHWYDTEHMPDAVRLFKGCTGGARYKVVDGDGSHQFIAMYAFESEQALKAVLTGEEIKGLIKEFDAKVGGFTKRGRTLYSRILLQSKTS